MNHAQRELHEEQGQVSQVPLPRSAARVLAACAMSPSLFRDFPFRDALAEGLLDSLSLDPRLFAEEELRPTAFRALVMDRLAEHFFARQPHALGVGICPLLGTRGHRLNARWVDVDPPEIARLRLQYLPQREGLVQVGACLCNPNWVDAVSGKAGRRLLLVIDESVLPLPSDTLMNWLDAISARVSSGSELLVAYDAEAPIRPLTPLTRGSAVELVVRAADGTCELARYPRLRFVEDELYPEELRTSLAGVNAIAAIHRGIGAPALAHLRVV